MEGETKKLSQPFGITKASGLAGAQYLMRLHGALFRNYSYHLRVQNLLQALLLGLLLE